MKAMPKFSVVTVCYNEEQTIAETIESVLSQNINSYEYIICDGGSTDKTVEIAKSYDEQFKKVGVSYSVFSEKDGGIYFGMNKGISTARGEYLYFLNAGDKLHSKVVLQTVCSILKEEAVDILYGDIVKIERGFGSRINGDIGGMKEGMSICHQAMFIKTELLKKHPYNTKYQIIADYEFAMSMLRQGRVFQHIDLIIADYKAGGVSTTNVERIAKEYFECKTHMGMSEDYTKRIKNAQKNYTMQKVKAKIPLPFWKLYNVIRGRKSYD